MVLFQQALENVYIFLRRCFGKHRGMISFRTRLLRPPLVRVVPNTPEERCFFNRGIDFLLIIGYNTIEDDFGQR